VFDFLAAQAPKVDNNKSLEILIKPAEPEKARLATPPIDGTTLETKQPQPAVEAVPVLEPSSSKELPLQKPPDVNIIKNKFNLIPKRMGLLGS